MRCYTNYYLITSYRRRRLPNTHLAKRNVLDDLDRAEAELSAHKSVPASPQVPNSTGKASQHRILEVYRAIYEVMLSVMLKH